LAPWATAVRAFLRAALRAASCAAAAAARSFAARRSAARSVAARFFAAAPAAGPPWPVSGAGDGVRTAAVLSRAETVPRFSGAGAGEARNLAEAETDVAQLAFEAARAHLLAGVLVEGGGMQRVGDALQRGRAQLVAIGAEQATRGVDEGVDGVALARPGLAQRAGVTAPGEQVGLRGAHRVAGREELGHGAPLRAHELVDRPGGG